MTISLSSASLGRRHQVSGCVPEPFVGLRPLGTGGEGEAWLAFDPRFRRKVLLKRMRTGHHAEAFSGVDEESPPDDPIALLANLSLAQVPAVYDWIEWQGSAWLVMEYVEGVTLSKVLNSAGGRLGAGTLYVIFLDLVAALDALTTAGWVHGDIAPDNVIIDPAGGARLIDFGQMALQRSRTAVAVVPGYQAPETLHGERLNEKTDGFALGALIHRAMTGTEPSLDVNAHEVPSVYAAAATGPFSPIEALLWQITGALLCTDPRERPRFREVNTTLVQARYVLHEDVNTIRQSLAHRVEALDMGTPEPLLPSQEHREASLRSSSPIATARLGLTAIILTVGLALAVGVGVLYERSTQVSSDAFFIGVEAISITPNTPIPTELDKAWLVAELARAIRDQSPESTPKSHRLKLTLTCLTTFCQLQAQHRMGDRSHWHQVSLVATDTLGVWQGVMRDLGIRIAAD